MSTPTALARRSWGCALTEYTRRDEVVIATKVCEPMASGPNRGGLSRKAIFTELDASLRRLGTDYIDLYQIHRADPTTPWEETLEALHDAVKPGKVRYIGVSSLWAWEFTKTLCLQTINGWTRFVSIQDHYNLLDREEEREVHPLCSDQHIAVMPWSPLARGKLTRDWDAETKRSQTDPTQGFLYEGDADQAIVAKVAEIAAARGIPRRPRYPTRPSRTGLDAEQTGGHGSHRRSRQAAAPRRRHCSCRPAAQ